jgi:hypothetical protein
MNENSKKISRKELYDQIWTTPITKLSKQYGLSDVGFAKICKKYNIPRPPRGYWAKQAAGHNLKRIPLPPGKEELIEINANPFRRTDLKTRPEKRQNIPVIVPKTLRNPHPLVKDSAEKLELCEPNNLGILKPPDKNCLEIRVSKKTLRRALRIMNALITALNDRDYRLGISDGSTVVEIQDVTLKFGISEDLKTERKPARDFDIDGYYQFGHSRFDYDRVPSGNLCLTIHESRYYLRGSYRKNWRDTKTKRLENLLGSFISGLENIAIRTKEHIREEEERERKRREWQKEQEEKARILEEKRRLIEVEQKRVSDLISDADNWKKSKVIREYVSAVERAVLEGKSTFKPEGELKHWIKWALQQADRLDPLTESPPSILDDDIEDDPGDDDDYGGFSPPYR